MKNILFLGSKPIGYKALEFLIINSNKINCRVVGVLSNDNNLFGNYFSVKKLSAQHNIPIIDQLDDILNLEHIDVIISVQYHLILKEAHIRVAKDIAVNLHMAPLPEYRGCNQFSFAILNESRIFGTTLHQLETGIDNGAIIAEKRFEIPKDCFVHDLYEMTYAKSIELFEENIDDIINGNYILTPQSELIKERGTHLYYRKDIQKIKKIDLGTDAKKIDLAIRATAMPGFEPPYTIIENRKYYIIPEAQYKK